MSFPDIPADVLRRKVDNQRVEIQNLSAALINTKRDLEASRAQSAGRQDLLQQLDVVLFEAGFPAPGPLSMQLPERARAVTAALSLERDRNADLLKGIVEVRDAIPSGGTLSHFPNEIREMRTELQVARAEAEKAEGLLRFESRNANRHYKEVKRLTAELAAANARVETLEEAARLLAVGWRARADDYAAFQKLLNAPAEVIPALAEALRRRSAPKAPTGPKDSGQHQGTPVGGNPGSTPRASSKEETTPSSATAPAAGNVAESHDDPGSAPRVVGPEAGRATERGEPESLWGCICVGEREELCPAEVCPFAELEKLKPEPLTVDRLLKSLRKAMGMHPGLQASDLKKHGPMQAVVATFIEELERP